MKSSEITTLIIAGGAVAAVFLLTQGGSNAVQSGLNNITEPVGEGLEVVTIIGGIGLLLLFL
jgi:hypothetical protein